MFSILHISDLHRSPLDPITNSELITALVHDRDRYIREDVPVPAPDAIIVSGDIIQGVPLQAGDFKAELTKQYAVAEEFLVELANQFLAGDRSRVIVVPGNHDVDWNTSHQAMQLAGEKDTPADLPKALFRENSRYRWDWKNRELYRISNEHLYAQRLGSYRDFFQNFYAGTKGLLRVSPDSDANLFELHDGKIVVAAFNSCDGNDCFASHGSISRQLIAKTDLDLRHLNRAHTLRIAVWHHNIEGPPYRTDYMDVDVIRGMIGRGFRLGLFGHQHKIQATPHQIYLPDKETMAVVSAGSLCAGAVDLPTGVNRQYNVIELADDLQSARIHVREMLVANLFGRSSLNAWAGKSYATLNWELPPDSAGRTIEISHAKRRIAIDQAEQAWKSGDPKGALALLRSFAANFNTYERKLFLNIANDAKDWDEVIEAIKIPASIEELIFLTQALTHQKAYGSARAVIETFGSSQQLPHSVQQELLDRISSEERLQR